MRFKYIGIVGATLIAIAFTFCVTMYYSNKDQCSFGTFPCANSTKCIPQRDWCNGVDDCPEKDDESSDTCTDIHGPWNWIYGAFEENQNKSTNYTCGYKYCAEGCKCNDNCYTTCFNITYVPQDMSIHTKVIMIRPALTELSKNYFRRYTRLRDLNVSHNELREIKPGQMAGMASLQRFFAKSNKIEFADFSDFANSDVLNWLDLGKNNLTSQKLFFPSIPGLEYLILSDNQLGSVTRDLFSPLENLLSLNLANNGITTIDEHAFDNIKRLMSLNLVYNDIKSLPSKVFHPLKELEKLSIGHNPLEDIPYDVFSESTNLKSLGVQEIDMDDLDRHVFDALNKLEFVYFKKFYYCGTYAPNVTKCWPASDGVSSIQDLLGKPLLRAAVWGISCATCLGNALVLWGRFTAKDENRVLSIVIRNLAVSDMLMGLYLLIIAVEDMRFRDSYNRVATSWMSSWFCTFLGIMAMTSSEVSVLILSFMSVERFLLIVAPLKTNRALTPQGAFSSMLTVWIIGIVLAILPVIHWRSSTRFYGVNGMCFPLHIDDPFLVGWEYSAFIFLGLNLFGLLIIAYVYVRMFTSIWSTRHATPLSIGESEFALRFFLIVLTDAACWAPIIILKILALTSYPVPPDLHAWVVVFILPVNSAVNPLLYTFTTPKFRERLSEGWLSKMQDFMDRNFPKHDVKSNGTRNRNMAFSLANESAKINPKMPVFSVPCTLATPQNG